jgi:prohibitin 2
MVRENLTRRALRFNLVLDDVSITHVAFSPEFTHAVEAKQVCRSGPLLCSHVSRTFKVAQQTALRAAFLVDQAIQEKQVCDSNSVPSRTLTSRLISLSSSERKAKHAAQN